MTRKQLENARHLYDALAQAGFDRTETDSLRRIEMTLHRWAERECNGEIERDGDDSDGRPFQSFPNSGQHMAYRIPDRERGALQRLAVIMAKHHGWRAYHQGDPRGCALWIIRRRQIPKGGSIDSYYTRGIAICY